MHRHNTAASSTKRKPEQELPPLPYPVEVTIPAGPPDVEVSYQPRFGPEFRREDLKNQEDGFASLKYFDTVLLIDDSNSMLQYWGEVGMILRKIAPVLCKYDKDGITIEFINHRPRGCFLSGGYKTGYYNIGNVTGVLDMMDNVEGIYHRVKPKGKCKLNKRLGSILDEYVYQYDLQMRLSGGKRKIKPLNLIIITAGDVDEEFGKTLINNAAKLDKYDAPSYQVGVQFFQVGDDQDAREEFQYGDDEFCKDQNVRDIVDTSTWSGRPGDLSPQGLRKVVLGAVLKSLDEEPML